MDEATVAIVLEPLAHLTHDFPQGLDEALMLSLSRPLDSAEESETDRSLSAKAMDSSHAATNGTTNAGEHA